MIVAGHQPNYLPYLGFFHKMAQCDTFVIVDTVQFVKRGPFGWIHRNKIRTKEGWMWLTVPVLTKGKYTQRIMDVYINNSIPWRRKHWKSIWLNYQKAPYFNRYADFFYEVYNKEWEKLADLNEALILYIKESLGIKTRVLKASTLGVGGKATELIIDICEKLGADVYLHGVHGKDYVDTNQMQERGIKSLFQEFYHPRYSQLNEPFVANLSVIDLLFNEGERGLEILMKGEASGMEGGKARNCIILEAGDKDDRVISSLH
jgi:hypothetical protein